MLAWHEAGRCSVKWQPCSSNIWLRCNSQAGTASKQLLHEALASLHNSSGTAAACQWGCDSVMMPSLSDAPKWCMPGAIQPLSNSAAGTQPQPVHGSYSIMSVCIPTAVQPPRQCAPMANIARPSAPQTRQLGLPPGRTPSPQLWLQPPAAPCSVAAAAAQQVQLQGAPVRQRQKVSSRGPQPGGCQG